MLGRVHDSLDLYGRTKHASGISALRKRTRYLWLLGLTAGHHGGGWELQLVITVAARSLYTDSKFRHTPGLARIMKQTQICRQDLISGEG